MVLHLEASLDVSKLSTKPSHRAHRLAEELEADSTTPARELQRAAKPVFGLRAAEGAWDVSPASDWGLADATSQPEDEDDARGTQSPQMISGGSVDTPRTPGQVTKEGGRRLKTEAL